MGMTRTLAVELGQFNIRCNAICPGYIETPLLGEWLDGLDNPDEMRGKIAGDAPVSLACDEWCKHNNKRTK
jgi:NAD(P)-dependent dehydrogenase (short-subunit alcohol dehydrogenase family)